MNFLDWEHFALLLHIVAGRVSVACGTPLGEELCSWFPCASFPTADPFAVINGDWEWRKFLNLVSPSSKSWKLKVVLGAPNTEGMSFLLRVVIPLGE